MVQVHLGPLMEFLALCYHYLRQGRDDPYPRILGNSVSEFRDHLGALRTRYVPIDLDRALEPDRPAAEEDQLGILITFDDGLSEHLLAARILHEEGIRGVFFVPTCLVEDARPPNPTIIHYCLAIHPISRFLAVARDGMDELGITTQQLPTYESGDDDPWQTIADIKRFFNRALHHRQARALLLFLFDSLLEERLPQGLATMNLTKEGISEIVSMGHSIGVHSHSHISIGSASLTDEEWFTELVRPREVLQTMFSTPVVALSYPFGKLEDCLSAEALIEKAGVYRAAFTVQEIVNTADTHRLELGRYMPHSTDDADRLMQKLVGIEQNGA